MIGRTFADKGVQSDMKYFPFKVKNVKDKPFIELAVDGKKKVRTTFTVVFKDNIYLGALLKHIFSSSC